MTSTGDIMVVKSVYDRAQKNSAAGEVCQPDRISVTVSLVARHEYEKLYPAAAVRKMTVVAAFDVPAEIDKL